MALVIYRIPVLMEQDRTQQVVAQIHAQKLTINDVNGEHLPPPPDPAQVDATIEGVDANGNGIRDDVELAIFEKYPNSARIRAAELQYAKALQMELTQVSNSDTLVAAIQEADRASSCIAALQSRDNLKEFLALSKVREKEVENLQINTDMRRQKRNEIFNFLTSYGPVDRISCDVNIQNLSG